jgi:hypothetical protein
MGKENGSCKRAAADSDRELERITDKYIFNRIRDDGLSDALAYAVVERRHSLVVKDEWQKEKWDKAIRDATEADNPNLETLRQEIREQGEVFIDTAKGDRCWEEYGRALINLAGSF